MLINLVPLVILMDLVKILIILIKLWTSNIHRVSSITCRVIPRNWVIYITIKICLRNLCSFFYNLLLFKSSFLLYFFIIPDKFQSFISFFIIFHLFPDLLSLSFLYNFFFHRILQ